MTSAFWQQRLVLVIILVIVLSACRQEVQPGEILGAAESLTALKGEDTGQFSRAIQPRDFVFPADHGPHPAFRNEWWYVTGNLTDEAGQAYGYQFTLFRIGLQPERESNTTGWRTNQVYLGHLAVTDVAGQRHHHHERIQRGSLGLAGSHAEPWRVWLQDWQLISVGNESWPVQIQAQHGDFGIDLQLQPRKPLVLQGEAGLSAKSAAVGNASYYYSYTRLATSGQLTVAGKTLAVQGESWLDREWSTSALAEHQVGWDWFALQLANGHELMYYQMRDRDGLADPISKGILVDPAGQGHPIQAQAITLQPLKFWQSPDTGKLYPVRWRLQLPEQGIDLTTTAKLAGQEMRTSVLYWEGAVAVAGTWQNQAVTGQGYIEMTGY